MKRKILSLILVVMMMFTALPALNVSAALATGSITINAPVGFSIDGVAFKVYQLFTAIEVDDGYIYTVTTPFDAFRISYDFTNDSVDNPQSYKLDEFLNAATAVNGELISDHENAITHALMDWIELPANAGSFDTVKEVFTADSTAVPTADLIYTQNATGDKLEIKNLPLGYYLVDGSAINKQEKGENPGLDEQANLPANNLITAICSLKTAGTAVINLKLDAPTVDKDVLVKGGDKDEEDDWVAYTDFNIGDTVSFRLTSKVPNMRGYKGYDFTMYDFLSGGLTFDPAKADFTVTINGVAVTDYDLWYSLDDTIYFDNYADVVTAGYEAGEPLYIAIDFNDFIQYKSLKDKAIVVIFDTILNEEATITTLTEGREGNPNDVWLEYSNNPYDKGNGEPGDGGGGKKKSPRDRDRDRERERGRTPKKRVRVFTFELAIFKTDDGVNYLEDAKFNLYRDDTATSFSWDSDKLEATGGTLIKFTMKGIYNYIHNKTTGNKDFVTVDNGIIYLTGLEAGTYYIVEIEAPDGFELIKDPIQVIIDYTTDYADNKLIDFTALLEYTVNDGNSEENAYLGQDEETIFIINQKGGKFPETGGIGTRIFYIVGSVMALGAIITLAVYVKVSSKKKGKNAA